MALKTFDDVRRESVSYFKEYIEKLEWKLSHTKKTTKRRVFEKEILYWQSEIDEIEYGIKRNKFFERYPDWMPK